MKFASEEQSQTALIILMAVEHLNTGKNKLAAFLKGSQSKLIKDGGLDKRAGYGALLWLDVSVIKSFITQLEEMEFLSSYFVRTGDYQYPQIHLTLLGKKALHEKIDIPLCIRGECVISSESERETLALFDQGYAMEQISEKRELTSSTVWNHFARLVEAGDISARAFVAQDTIERIVQVIMRIPTARLKIIKQALPDVSYDEIKVVIADKTLVKLRGV